MSEHEHKIKMTKAETEAAINTMAAVEDAHALGDPTFVPAKAEEVGTRKIGNGPPLPWNKTHNGPAVLEVDTRSRSDVHRALEEQERRAEDRAKAEDDGSKSAKTVEAKAAKTVTLADAQSEVETQVESLSNVNSNT